MGHGIYRRQVLGLPDVCRSLICVRRYRCRGCGRTISVLPDTLHPRRWYSATAILLSLVEALVMGLAASRVRGDVASGESCEVHGWKTLRRWQRQLLCPLWGWLSRQLGVDARPSDGRVESRRRLVRLLALHGATGLSPPEEIERVAQLLVVDTAHVGSRGWSMRRREAV